MAEEDLNPFDSLPWADDPEDDPQDDQDKGLDEVRTQLRKTQGHIQAREAAEKADKMTSAFLAKCPDNFRNEAAVFLSGVEDPDTVKRLIDTVQAKIDAATPPPDEPDDDDGDAFVAPVVGDSPPPQVTAEQKKYNDALAKLSDGRTPPPEHNRALLDLLSEDDYGIRTILAGGIPTRAGSKE